jgi:hypothetical protein
LLPLLIVIFIVVGVTSGLRCSHLAAARERDRRKLCHGCLNNAINYACHLYASDFEGAFPSTLGDLYPDHISDGAVFLCRSAGKAIPVEDNPRIYRDGVRDYQHRQYTPDMFGDTHSDYVYVSGLRPSDPGDYILAFEDEWNHDGEGVHVLLVGGGAPKDSDWWPDIKALHEQLAKQEKELAAKGRKMKLLRPAWSTWPEPPAELSGHRLRLRDRIAVAVGMMVAIVVALALVVRTVRRGRKTGGAGNAR